MFIQFRSITPDRMHCFDGTNENDCFQNIRKSIPHIFNRIDIIQGEANAYKMHTGFDGTNEK